MESIDCKQKIEELKKENRVLQKKLERSEIDREQLEEANERKEALLNEVIRELRESQRMTDDFLSTVSHELRSPMTSIRMATQML